MELWNIKCILFFIKQVDTDCSSLRPPMMSQIRKYPYGDIEIVGHTFCSNVATKPKEFRSKNNNNLLASNY